MKITYGFSLFYNESVNGTSRWTLFNTSHYFFTIGQANEELVISSSLFSDYKYSFWKIQLSSYSNGYIQPGNSSIVFFVNYPPKNGTCNVNPINGTTSVDFTIVCQNWIDPDGVSKYVYYGTLFFCSNLRGFCRQEPPDLESRGSADNHGANFFGFLIKN
jgi:hypothetical protein